MRYALNAAPINGWQTFNGVGSSSMVVAASGDALAAELGQGDAEMVMAASGDAASVELGVGAGAAALSMVATGDAKEATLGTAAAAMAMSASGSAADAQKAAGAAAMLMGLVHGIQYKPIPAGFVENKRDRTMRVGADDRRFTVAPEVQYRLRPERALRVARESRSV